MSPQEQSLTSALTLESESKLMELAAPSEKLTALVKYSAGRIPRSAAMDALCISDYGYLLQALNSVELPHPLLNKAARKVMVKTMLTMVEGGLGSDG